jgi:DNA-binding NarL/FixJ family response regulator
MIHVLIADDFKLLRAVIRRYLERAGDIHVVDESPDLDDALERTKALRPDVIVMNGDLPPIDSAHATTHLRKQGYSDAILVISMHLEPQVIQRSFLSGANGFMHKDEIDEYLVNGVRRVHLGERFLSPKALDAYRRIQE